jgi:hypothetical protein
MHGDMASSLSELQYHWGEAYIIARPEPDVWIAERRDTHGTLRAGSPSGLREKIVADYDRHPVPR